MARLGDKFKSHAQMLGASAPGLSLHQQRPALTEIPVSQIEPDPDQPRRDLGDLAELAASIKEIGLVQPIIVTISGYERYRIVAGERRFSAAKLAGLLRVSAVVRTVEEHQRLELQLVENLHRKDLTPFEEAETYRRLLSDFGLTHEGLGKRIGKTQVSITETLKILELPQRIQEEAVSGTDAARRVTKTVLLEIARRPSAEQLSLWSAAVNGEMTVRKMRALRGSPEERKQLAMPKPKGVSARYPIVLVERDATVTVELRSEKSSLENIVAALEEALKLEKERLPITNR